MTRGAAHSLDHIGSPPIAGGPIDVAHLERMTLGDRKLEIQVLELFDRQADLLLARMQKVDPAGVASLAHTLAGSARGVGAWRVAGCAEAVERAATTGRFVPALARLGAAVAEARLTIADIIGIAGPV